MRSSEWLKSYKEFYALTGKSRLELQRNLIFQKRSEKKEETGREQCQESIGQRVLRK